MDYTNNTDTYTYKEEDISENFYFFNVLKDGRVHVLAPDTPDAVKIPPSDDVITGVKIKDISINDDVSARVFLPPSRDGGGEKVPVLLYVHGGAFCMGSAFSVEYTRFLSTISKECGVISVSVEYGLFPTRVMPACYEDCWFALQWLASHGDLNVNNEEWLTQTIEDDGKVLVGLPADQHPLIKASLEHQRNYWIKRREAVRLVNKASSSSSSSSSSYPRRPVTRNLAAARDMLSCTLPTLSPHASRVLAYIQSVIAKYEANDPEVSGIPEWRDWWQVEKRFLRLTGVVPAYYTSFDF